MTNCPKISIVLTTFNRAHLIENAMYSILSQTYKNYEVIIVDDGSTDNTKRMLGKFLRNDNIKYIYQENKGYPSALNKGVKLSKGDYIAIHDSDDLWLPIYLEKMISTFLNIDDSKYGMVYANVFNYNPDSQDLYIRYNNRKLKEGNLLKEFAFREIHIYHGAALIRKNCFEKVGLFDENLRRSLDREFNYRFSKHFNFKLVNQPLAIVRLHGKLNPKDKLDDIQYEEQIEKYEKNILARLVNDRDLRNRFKFFDLRIISRYNYIWGKHMLLIGNVQKAKKYLVSAIAHNPFNSRAWYYFIFCMLGVYNKRKFR